MIGSAARLAIYIWNSFKRTYVIPKGIDLETYKPMTLGKKLKGKPAILSFFRGITERKRIEILLDHLVHEINGRNQILISNMEKLIASSTDNKLNEQLKGDLSLLFNNANAIKRAYKLLKVAQDERELFPIDIVNIINEVTMVVTHQFPNRDLHIRTHIDGMIQNILADGFIEDVFSILFENSVEQTDDGPVEINVYIKADSVLKEKYIDIRIEDHSNGIPDDKKEKTFDQFTISKEEGRMGLGISMVKSVLDRYSGEIHVEDRVEGDHTKGSAFVIRLPEAKYNK